MANHEKMKKKLEAWEKLVKKSISLPKLIFREAVKQTKFLHEFGH